MSLQHLELASEFDSCSSCHRLIWFYVRPSCCQLSRFWSCRSFFTRGIQSASSPAAVNTIGDLDSGLDQTCLKIHFLVSSLLLFSDLGPARDFYACRAASASLVFLLRLPNYHSCVICSPARFCPLVFSFWIRTPGGTAQVSHGQRACLLCA
jgi:hypothetical protein